MIGMKTLGLVSLIAVFALSSCGDDSAERVASDSDFDGGQATVEPDTDASVAGEATDVEAFVQDPKFRSQAGTVLEAIDGLGYDTSETGEGSAQFEERLATQLEEDTIVKGTFVVGLHWDVSEPYGQVQEVERTEAMSNTILNITLSLIHI